MGVRVRDIQKQRKYLQLRGCGWSVGHPRQETRLFLSGSNKIAHGYSGTPAISWRGAKIGMSEFVTIACLSFPRLTYIVSNCHNRSFQCRGFPTLLLFVNGESIANYTAQRNVKSFKQFIFQMLNGY